MNKKVLALFCLLCFTRFSWAAIGLAVDPGEVILKDVPLGKVVKVSEIAGEGMKLKITNKSDSAFTYTIDILPTAKTTAKLTKGYADIPKVSWITPETREVRVPAHSEKEVELYLKIPKSKKYYNKNYQAIIEVKSKKNRPEELFVLACQLRVCLSTNAGGKNAPK